MNLNPQAFDVSQMQSVREACEETPKMASRLVQEMEFDKGFNTKRVQHQQPCRNEQPWHRRAAMLYVQGYSPCEVADLLQVSKRDILRLKQEPWFQDLLVKEFNSTGRQALDDMIKLEAMPALRVVVEIMNDPKQKGATRLAAANSVIDRFAGKSVQRVESVNVNTNVSAVPDIDNRLAEIESEMKRLVDPNPLNSTPRS